ncbi:Protein TAR1 [Capsicum baccatum]|uniref:Protein TAR1 n=1 Tax=Capsicum baccatum TaxID=33114 RepID=A0A2G2UX43_CAPBA|nr:Protein TAR1 [Capsicum baccatum]
MPKQVGGVRCLQQSRRQHSTSVSRARALAAPPIHTGPRPGSIGVLASRRSTYDRFPPNNFKHFLTLFSKSFSSFPRGTCSLSVSRPYLALDGIHCHIWAAFPNNPTRRQRLVVRQGLGTTRLSPSPTPPSRELGPGSRSERLSAKGSWSPDARRAVAATAKRVELQPPLAVTSVDVDSHLGQTRARGAREANIRTAMTARPVIKARCEGTTRCMTPGQTCPRPNGLGRNLRSRNRWFTGFCNSHQVSHFAMFFIYARAQISIFKSRFRLHKKHRCPRFTPQTGRKGQAIDSSIPWRFPRRGSLVARRARWGARSRDRGRLSCGVPEHPARADSPLVIHILGVVLLCRFNGLLAMSRAANCPRRRDPNISPDHSIGRSDGQCVQRAGT